MKRKHSNKRLSKKNSKTNKTRKQNGGGNNNNKIKIGVPPPPPYMSGIVNYRGEYGVNSVVPMGEFKTPLNEKGTMYHWGKHRKTNVYEDEKKLPPTPSNTTKYGTVLLGVVGVGISAFFLTR